MNTIFFNINQFKVMNNLFQNKGRGNQDLPVYSAPTISLLEVSIEQGFANSNFEHEENDPY